MKNVLLGQAFLWASSDPSGVVTAAMAGLLSDLIKGDSIRLKLTRATDPENLTQIISSQAIGLALWVLREEAELPSACRSIVAARAKRKGPVCIAFMESIELAIAPILIESGAHMALSSISALQSALPKIVSVAPCSSQAFHPLTSGLLQRLPWKDA